MHTPRTIVRISAGRLADGGAAFNLPADPKHLLFIEVRIAKRDLGKHCHLVVKPSPGDSVQIVAQQAHENMGRSGTHGST